MAYVIVVDIRTERNKNSDRVHANGICSKKLIDSPRVSSEFIRIENTLLLKEMRKIDSPASFVWTIQSVPNPVRALALLRTCSASMQRFARVRTPTTPIAGVDLRAGGDSAAAITTDHIFQIEVLNQRLGCSGRVLELPVIFGARRSLGGTLCCAWKSCSSRVTPSAVRRALNKFMLVLWWRQSLR